jgi:ribosomal protein L20A (L18A)
LKIITNKGKIKTKEQNTDNMNFNKKLTAEAPEEIVPLFY